MGERPARGPGNALSAPRALSLRRDGPRHLPAHPRHRPAAHHRNGGLQTGCARLVNSHIEHLYGLVPLDTKRSVLYPKGWSARVGLDRQAMAGGARRSIFPPMRRLAALLACLASPAGAWEFTPLPICTLSEDGPVSVIVT